MTNAIHIQQLKNISMLTHMIHPDQMSNNHLSQQLHLLRNYLIQLLIICSLRYSSVQRFPNLRPYNSHKFSPRSKECAFLKYSQNHKGYKCLHIDSGPMYISRDVIFHEDQFPFAATPIAFASLPPIPAPVLPPLLCSPIVSIQSPPSATVSPSTSISSPSPPNSADISMPSSSSYTDTSRSATSHAYKVTKPYFPAKTVHGWHHPIPCSSGFSGRNTFST